MYLRTSQRRGEGLDYDILGKRGRHTSRAKSIHNLIRLLLIVKIPSLLESPYRLGSHVGSPVLLAKLEAIENKNTSHAQILKDLQLPLDVVLQREWETAQCDQERFAGGLVEEVLGDVVRRIDTDHGPFKGREGERLEAGGSPFIQGTDC